MALFRDRGNLLGHAEALNRLGELSLRTSEGRRDHTTPAEALRLHRLE